MDKKNLTIEEANELIEQNVSKLENEALPIKETMKLYTDICELIEYSLNELGKYQGIAQLGADGLSDVAELEGADFYEE